MKTISNLTPVRLTSWDATKRSEMVMVYDMGLDPDLGTTDADCLFGAARTLCLSSDPAYYDIQDKRYANPVVLSDGELVKLDRNGRIYRIKCMGRNERFEYYSDLLHFELVG